MLPYFVAQDFRDVLRDLNRVGYPFEAEWFAPHFEFRYPVFGHAHHAGIDIEIRQATEPWYVLGEEGAAGGTARYVDSSVERVQVKVEGLVERPLRDHLQRPPRAAALHRQAGRVGGGRALSRLAAAFLPASHHSGAHAADLRCASIPGPAGRVGGCSYHVSHPGGRSHDTFPVNANEAESRRASRFFPFGHTPARCASRRPKRIPSFR